MIHKILKAGDLNSSLKLVSLITAKIDMILLQAQAMIIKHSFIVITLLSMPLHAR